MQSTIPPDPQPKTPRRQTIRLLIAILAAAGTLASIVSWRISLSSSSKRRRSPSGVELPLCERTSGCRLCGGRGLHPLPCGDRRDLPPAPDGPLARHDPGRARTGAAIGRPGPVRGPGLEYSIEHRDGQVLHQETRRDASGRIVARNEAEVQFVIGSGRQGVAYLVERDGFLFLSPMTWYPRSGGGTCPPAIEKENLHFYRPVQPECLYCHANRVEPVAGTINRYRPPIFRGHAIGCERCHGPGELHVKDPSRSTAGT